MAESPPEPFSPPEAPARRRRVASRIMPAQVAAFAVVIATAVALLVYFAVRG